MFKDAPIEGARILNLKRYTDQRGWLVETFRHDEVDSRYHPVMSYVSLTHPGFTRGPHEHVDQSDLCIFMGPGTFEVWLWDSRPDSPTYRHRHVVTGGQDNPIQVLVPPGVVHAYRNIGDEDALVLNYPNQLFMGEGKKHPIDEIRHEDDPASIYQCE